MIMLFKKLCKQQFHFPLSTFHFIKEGEVKYEKVSELQKNI